MNRIYIYLLGSAEWTLEYYFGEKSFSFRKSDGDWSKTVHISKYGKEYEIKITEGLPNIIKRTEIKCNTYKEVIKFIG
jgi:hypothetical protein